MRSPAIAMFCALLLGGVALGAEPRLPKLVAYETGEFTVITSRSSNQARQFIEDLTKFRITLEKLLGKRAAANPVPTRIVIVGAGDWRKYLQPRDNVAGFFQSARFTNTMALDGDASRWFATPLLFHEYSHYYLSSQFSGEYPPWFNEGLAELMAYAMFTDQGRAVLRVPMHQVYEARDGDWIPFERLIQVDNYAPEYQSHKLMASFYAQAWLTVHYGFVGNREFGQKIITYLNDLNSLRPQPEAARSAFGADLAAMDQALREYSRTTSFQSGALSLGEVPPVDLPAGTPLGENDAYAVFIDVMFDTNFPPGRIRPLVEALARREPAAARPAIFAARLAALEDDGAAFSASVERARAALPADDWQSRRELAAVLLDSALATNPLSKRTSDDDDRDLKLALQLSAEAVAHNGEDIEALWAFGSAASRLDRNLDLAEQALKTAYRLAPANGEIAVSLANLKGRQQEPDEMIPYLRDAIRYAGSLQTRRWAVDTLAEMQRYIAQRDALEAENRKAREEYERKLAEHEKKYGKSKKKAP